MRNVSVKLIFAILGFFLRPITISAQQNLLDFEESIPVIKLYYKSGRIDLKAKNPQPGAVNGSARCAKYIRTSNEKYDNIKFELIRNLVNISNFTNLQEQSPKIRMKIFTSAPTGTMIEIQLGKISGLEYPMSVYAQFQAFTVKQNEWEELEFKFIQIPKGTLVKPTEINRINILFAPEIRKSEVFYFDDLIGPMLTGDTIVRKNEKK
jgi:hypothetical protein